MNPAGQRFRCDTLVTLANICNIPTEYIVNAALLVESKQLSVTDVCGFVSASPAAVNTCLSLCTSSTLHH